METRKIISFDIFFGYFFIFFYNSFFNLLALVQIEGGSHEKKLYR